MPVFSPNSDQSVSIILATIITTGSDRKKKAEGGGMILQEINTQAKNTFICTFVPSSQKEQAALATAH